MSLVVLKKCASYEAEELAPALKALLFPLGGMEQFVKPGMRVLIKPNMLCGRPLERRVTTDPALVREVTRLVLAAGGEPVIADSPGIEPFRWVAAKSGLAKVAEELGVSIRPLDNPVPAGGDQGARFKHLELAELALMADCVINLAKLKTHCQMFLTLAVKNLFGTVVAQRKAEWHHMAGLDRDLFADLLLDISLAVKPALSILDGVWGMEKNGPSNGEPVKLSLLAASTDPLSLDTAVCGLLGQPLKRFPLNRAARARNLPGAWPENITLDGDPVEDLAPESFSAPELDTMHMVPAGFDWFTRRYLVSKPVVAKAACKKCGQCAKACPQQAVSMGAKAAVFDYRACIRCYCCQEVCPENAITYRKGGLVRLLNLLGR